jgi:hypothetical protein
VHASGPIEEGDAAQFAALPKFDTLELVSPGGLVGEALRMAANMDARGVLPRARWPLFVSGETRIYMGWRATHATAQHMMVGGLIERDRGATSCVLTEQGRAMLAALLAKARR